MLLNRAIEVFIGFASGLAVGCGFVAFLTVLGIIPRLVQLSKTDIFLRTYEVAVIVGSLFGTYLSFNGNPFHLSKLLVIIWGMFHGVFIGMLAAALTEVLNVFPLVAKRVGLEQHIVWLLMALVFGKIFGSLFQWLIFVKIN
ncbi:stage V sporulation protein AB [Aquibacillus sp. 3ASR75-11]|uniref:Stage V sporulation protein AB n=1 Tax=Terrihalobacillus insolitus TaxID=2950438 RepID=A0A9X3WSV2_9BACI|nr:stage V sporulation protein AB [Terrihalobacillus insolitus]MDC3413103.1 stage V sporulation protein AB [Terrihalobacillus insolitus]MDC3424845.1 stage V sporulation protein AB [Terrihalobacillus insolitus]